METFLSGGDSGKADTRWGAGLSTVYGPDHLGRGPEFRLIVRPECRSFEPGQD